MLSLKIVLELMVSLYLEDKLMVVVEVA